MPGPLLTFLSALFKIPKYKLFQSIVHDIEELLQPLEDEVHKEAEEQLKPDGETIRMLVYISHMCNNVCANPIIASSVVSDNEAHPSIKFGNEVIHELLNWIEEADARLVSNSVNELLGCNFSTWDTAGDDSMSKVGTKHAAFLMNFGETDTLSELDEELAEKDLIDDKH
ncbi:hypothetical protein DPMN_029214 [Dreissena polymorpha]|uniref:Uncharacterized protein n=1 Tax=Dreissena polymorpha TaxID=45954 RepID=A0A9D4RG15_DREPO|nr:hypothetical protein DPMN_029214 [Dreissena polymorpha]